MVRQDVDDARSADLRNAMDIMVIRRYASGGLFDFGMPEYWGGGLGLSGYIINIRTTMTALNI